jgi:hypothetical protein
MAKAIIEKFCKFAFFSIFVLLDTSFALSVDYGKHNCNHEHPKHHEVSAKSEISMKKSCRVIVDNKKKSGKWLWHIVGLISHVYTTKRRKINNAVEKQSIMQWTPLLIIFYVNSYTHKVGHRARHTAENTFPYLISNRTIQQTASLFAFNQW